MTANSIGISTFVDLSGMRRGQKEYNRILDQMGSSTSSTTGIMGGAFSSLGTGLSNVAKIAGGALVAGVGLGTVAIGALGASSISAAKDMEQSVADIRSVFSGVAPTVEQLNSLILGLGVDPGLKVNATEAAEAIQLLARNGLTWEEISSGAAKSSILLANATGAQFGTAADIATDAMKSFNIQVDDMDSAVNGVTSVVTNSKFTIDDYALALANGGAVTSKLGVTFQDFNTSIASTSNLFSSGQTAGTAFREFIKRLAPSTETAATELRNLGLFSGLTTTAFGKLQDKIATTKSRIDELDPTSKNYEQQLAKLNKELTIQESQLVSGNNAFFDSQGNLKSMAEISKILSDATVGLSEEQKNLAFTTIFGADAMTTAFGIIEAGKLSVDGVRTEFEVLQETMAQTDAANAVAIRMDTLSGKMEILGGIFESTKIAIGNAFLPALKDLADALINIAGENQEAVVGFFTNLAERLAIGLPNAINFMVSLWQGTLLPAFMEFSNFAKENLLPVFSSVVSFLKENVPLAIGIASEVWTSTLLPAINNASTFITDTLLPSFNSVVSFLKENIPLAVGIASNIWKETLLPAINDVSSGFNSLANFWKENGTAILEIATKVFGEIADLGIYLINNVFPFLTESFNKIAQFWETNGPLIVDQINAFSGTLSALSTVITTVWDVARPVFTALVDTILGLGQVALQVSSGDWSSAWNTIKETATNVMRGLTPLMSEVWETIKGVWSVQLQALEVILTVAWDNMKMLFTLGFGVVEALTVKAWETFKDVWSVGFEAVKVILDSSWETVKTLWSLAFDTIKAFTEADWDTIKSLFFTGFQSVGEIITNAWDIFKNVWSAGFEAVKVILTSSLDMAKSLWALGFDTLKAIVSVTWENITSILGDTTVWQVFTGVWSAGFEAVKVILETAWDNFKSLWSLSFEVLETVATTTWDNLKTTFSNSLSEISSNFNEIVESIKEKWNELFTQVKEAASVGWDTVKSSFSNAINSLTEATSNILSSVKSVFADFDWLSIGSNIIAGIVDGISNAAGQIGDALTNAAQSSFDAVTSFLGIESPSKLFKEGVGTQIVAGVVDGISEGTQELIKQAENLGRSVFSSFTDAVSGQTFLFSPITGGTSYATDDPLVTSRLGALDTLKKQNQFLSQQNRIVDEIARKGLDFGELTKGLTLGANMDVVELLELQVRLNRELLAQETEMLGNAEERARLSEAETRFKKEEETLRFLQEQQRTLEKATELGIGSIFDGFEFGINADRASLIDLMTQISQEMQQQIIDDWQIQSPSKVAARLSENIMAGFAQPFSRILGTSTNNPISGMQGLSAGMIHSPPPQVLRGSNITNNNNSFPMSFNIPNNSGNNEVLANQLADIVIQKIKMQIQ